MIIDTHCHYNLDPLFADAEQHWKTAQEHDVAKTIVVGTEIETNKRAIEFTKDRVNAYLALGYHPSNYQEQLIQNSGALLKFHLQKLDEEFAQLEQSIKSADKLIALGETGLDYFRLPEDETQVVQITHLQQEAFERHIRLAQQYKLPLIVHVRDREVTDFQISGNAYWDALKLLQEYDVKNFVLHCVSGPQKYVEAALEMGGYMGFDGNITYPNAQVIRDLFKVVPEERRVVETDAPYLPPQGYRGKVCEPWMIAKTVEYLEQEFQVNRQQLVENTLTLFPAIQ